MSDDQASKVKRLLIACPKLFNDYNDNVHFVVTIRDSWPRFDPLVGLNPGQFQKAAKGWSLLFLLSDLSKQRPPTKPIGNQNHGTRIWHIYR